jgi:hypothetical protein
MESRFLIINCPSAYFAYLPMGTFGLSSYLDQRKIPVRMLNLALYDKAQMGTILDYHLETFRPTHIGLTFHWQETAQGALWVGEYIRAKTNQVKIIFGGFTAGYFGEELLKNWAFADYVVKGDPEWPLQLLLEGADAPQIPNLTYRDGTAIKVNEILYCISEETISSLSFSTLTYLSDHELYVKAVEEKLGFPLFIGRGCVFDCDYCGGSREAFKLHSGRAKPVRRSIDSIMADLKRLQPFTRKIYICYEVDRGYIKALFKAIKADKTLVKVFRLNYGAWDLFDREFLELYRDVFIIDQEDRPLLELSPEVFDESGRKKVKHGKSYSMQELKANLGLINDTLSGGPKVYLFFSRYHDTTRTHAAMREEIFGIFRLKHELFAEKSTNVKVYYDHLSTDVGSRYWESYVDRPRNLDTLISWLRKLKSQEQYTFPVDNLCIYMPKTLSEQEIYKCELLVFILKRLEKYAFELFHVLFNCLDELVIGLVEEVIEELPCETSGNLFESLDHSRLLYNVERAITQDRFLLSRIPFIEDLTALQVKKATSRRSLQGAGPLYSTKRLRLNPAFISIHDHDYLDLSNFLERLEKEGPNNLKPEKAVFVFLVDDILSMPYATYRLTLKEFEKGISPEQYYALMDQRRIFNRSYHERLLTKMFESDVLC